jgi:predicted nucleotidyltransferase
MKLTQEDHNWLEAYRQALDQQFPGMVEHIILFGSKARGTATEESNLDLLVVIRRGAWRLKDAMRRPGYLLATASDVVPSIIVLTAEEWELLQKQQTPFWLTVQQDAIVLQ